MIDTDKYGMTNEELLERYSNLSVDDYKELLAEVKRLHTEFQEMLVDFQNVETDMWRMRDRIEAILKGGY